MTLRALIVDDERLARLALRSLLEERPDVTVVGEADSVVAARQRVAELKPDVVFLDVHMPGGSGFELFREGLAAKVVFCTAYEQFAVRAFEVNALDYLVKPVGPEQIDRALSRLPREVLAVQTEFRALLESEPVAFFVRRADDLLAQARDELGRFLGGDPDRVAFLPNATAGVNTVLRSLAPSFRPGDELLTTNHEYNACRNALEYVASLSGARVVVADIPFPLTSPSQALAAVVSHLTERTRLCLIDHVTSPTALVLPVAEIARAIAARGVEVLVDGAHAPGMLPLDLHALEADGVTYYTGNLHKWVCAPKGAAFCRWRRIGWRTSGRCPSATGPTRRSGVAAGFGWSSIGWARTIRRRGFACPRRCGSWVASCPVASPT